MGAIKGHARSLDYRKYIYETDLTKPFQKVSTRNSRDSLQEHSWLRVQGLGLRV